MSELQGWAQVAQIAQSLTVGGLLLVIVWAFYTNRVRTAVTCDKQIADAMDGKNRELALLVAERDRERLEKQEWKSVALELLQAGREGLHATVQAVETLKRSQT